MRVDWQRALRKPTTPATSVETPENRNFCETKRRSAALPRFSSTESFVSKLSSSLLRARFLTTADSAGRFGGALRRCANERNDWNHAGGALPEREECAARNLCRER